jgi:MoxR-like ATPase
VKKKPVSRKTQKPGPDKTPLVGRQEECAQVAACLASGRNVLLEGPVGVCKTQLALAICSESGRKVFRVDGDGRFTEQKLSGWFDPPLVIRYGYSAKSFVAGPLVEAMQSGAILFINELNRLPEGVQNVLLPAIDERRIVVPRLGAVVAKPGFSVIATQNPKEFVATSHLSEAILDRFELVVLDYQSEEEERAIVGRTVSNPVLVTAAVRLARLTRSYPRVKRGASVRAAQAVAEIAQALLATSVGKSMEQAFISAALLALPTRIEVERDADSSAPHSEEVGALIREWSSAALSGAGSVEKKKS